MKNRFLFSALLLIAAFCINNVKAQAPTITNFLPESGAIGSSVTITGTGFNATAEQNIVFFGATKAIVTAASATSLTVTVPKSSTFENISVTNLAVNLTAYSAKPFIVTLNGNVFFGNKYDLTGGTNPYSITNCDVDGDGLSDLLVTNYGSNTVSVFRNTSTSGSISFAASIDLTTGSSPVSLCKGDIDGDGKPDIAVANYTGNTVSVFRNTCTTGVVSFATKVDFTTGTSPSSVSMGDIDSDGLPDLAVAIESSSNVSVFRNISTVGSISFSANADFTVGSSPSSVCIGDMDGDGKPDLAVANYTSSTVSVLRSTSTTGNVSFATKVDYNTDSHPYFIVTGDLDGDGKPDLAVANYSGNTLSVFHNSSTSGTISFYVHASLTTGTKPNSVSIGDIDGDGKPDLAVCNESSNTVSVLQNITTTGYIGLTSKINCTTGTTPSSVCIGDFDGDSLPDMAVANYGSNSVSVFKQIIPPPVITSFSPEYGAVESSVTITGSFFNATAAQNSVYFGATKANITAASTSSLTVTVPKGATYQYISVTNLDTRFTVYSKKPFIITLSGNFAFANKQDLASGTNPGSVCSGDIDGDGLPDLVVANTNSNSVSVFRNTSTGGTVSFAAKVDFTTGTTPTFVTMGDLDGDGLLDLAVTNYISNSVSIFRNTSTSGALSFEPKIGILTGTKPNSLVIGDINFDGKPDLAVANEGTNNVWVLLNNSVVGTLLFDVPVILTAGTEPVSIVMGYINDDLYPDLAVANYGSNTVSVFRTSTSAGTTSFSTKDDFATGTGPISLSIGDLDGDGKSDLAVANITSNTVSVLRNLGNNGLASSFQVGYFRATGTSPNSVSIGDINGDGKPDLAVTNSGGTTASLFQNISTSGTFNFRDKVDFTAGTSPWSIVIGDINGDGKPDLATANYGSNTVSILQQLALIPPVISSFSPESGAIGSSVTINGTGFNTSTAQNIVFFGATQATVTAASATSLTVTVPIGATYQYISVTNLAVKLTAYSVKPYSVTLTGNIAFSDKQNIITGANPRSISVDDIDGDGKTDMVVVNTSSKTVSVFRNTSTSNSVSFATKVDSTTGLSPYAVCIGDLDGDGKLDLAVANNGSNSVSVFHNTSIPGNVSFDTKIDYATGSSPYSVCIGDIDGDGKPDMAVANNGSNSVSVFRNSTTSGTINFATKVDFTAGSQPSSVCIGDIDGDGKPDLTVANHNSSSVSLFRNTSTSGSINFAAKLDFSAGISPVSVSIGDIDVDGKADLVVLKDIYDANIAILRNNSTIGTINFDAKVDFISRSYPLSVAIGDLDGDGKPDLAVASSNTSTVSIFRNSSTAGKIGLAGKVDFTVDLTPYSVCIGDIESDGKPDLMVVNSGSYTVSVLKQIVPPQPTITSFNPLNGCTGAASVTIKGTNFTDAIGIKFGGSNALSYSIDSATQITAMVGSGATGKISVTTGVGTVNSVDTFTVNYIPPVPQAIIGNDTVCSSTGNIFKIPKVSTASSYSWTLPSGWSGSSAIDSIFAYAGGIGGNISVKSTNACGSSAAQVKSVATVLMPGTPAIITGNSTICTGTVNTYSIAEVSGAISYTWTLPAGWTGASTTTTIDVTPTTSGIISVVANNGFCSSSARSLNISVISKPTQPGIISGTATICESTTNYYNLQTVNGATSYTWTLPDEWTGTSTTNSISATASTKSGTIAVTADNMCGSSTPQTKAIEVNTKPNQPGSISGNTSICRLSSNNYSIATVSNATSYTWTLPAGWSGSLIKDSINARAGLTGGTISVKAYNQCGASAAQTLNVAVEDVVKPDAPILADVTGECSATATTPNTTDNCASSINGTTSDPISYSTQGTHVIAWTFDDHNGNSIVVNQNVIIDDITNPNTPNLQDITGDCSATAPIPTTNDNCAGTINGTTTDTLTYSTQGTHVIAWTFNDGNGNSIVVNQNVIVDDYTQPDTPFLPNIIGECSATTSAPTTNDNCSGTITGTTSDPLTYNTLGMHSVKWNFDDGNGNITEAYQNVQVVDETDPTITCVENKTINLNEGEVFYTVSGNEFDPETKGDNCAIGTIRNDYNNLETLNGVQFYIGTKIITWTIEDLAYNNMQCSFYVQVNAYNGIETIQPKGISMYPNPTTGMLNLEFANNTVLRIKISDLRGKILLEKTKLNKQETIDLSEFSKGVYLISFLTEKDMVTTKIVRE